MELRNEKEVNEIKRKNEDLSKITVELEKELETVKELRDHDKNSPNISAVSSTTQDSDLVQELEHSRLERDEAQNMVSNSSFKFRLYQLLLIISIIVYAGFFCFEAH